MLRTPALLSLAALLAACGTDTATVDAEPTATVTEVERTPSEVLAAAIADPARDDDRARDQFRNPQATLEFFGVEPGMRIAEVWPGWYTPILAPFARDTGGTYVAVLYPDEMGERAASRSAAFRETYGDTDRYGDIAYGSFGFADGAVQGAIAEPGSLDMILTFRNVHNWMGGDYAPEAFATFYDALKPGGVLGVVEHRLPETRVQDPTGRTGYVQESYMKDLAARAGFEFVESSEVNANPRDTADHPYGVWTLPPRSRTPEAGTKEAEDFDADLYRNVGESDRATLKFRKPL